ncbi:hypothetical protein [Ferrimicrobium sp.]|uniref:hypothetical protein n=1 Tax=Ferrimicrobium sp. TaxID=2926050 RepID=UPI002636704F|nr:hypothetical protein [Ferrimicrobium sp.]
MQQFPSLARKDVFILGAGFSKAINDSMPLASELLKPVLESLDGPMEPPRGGENFEQWLSRLAEAQPYLTVDQNLERSAAFIRVSRAIAAILIQCEQSTLAETLPDWFAKLLYAWHVRKATVISFNYDNLIESGVESKHLPIVGRSGVSSHDILHRLPPLPPQRQQEEIPTPALFDRAYPPLAGETWDFLESDQQTLRLIKLHGSLSWYWIPDDASGTTLQRWPDVGRFGSTPNFQLARIRQDLPGREVFIAPPSSTKSRYLTNPVTRQLWSDALEQLKSADRVFILGYSVPSQDQAAMGLLLEGLSQSGIAIRIVDRCPDVKERLESLIHNHTDPSLAGASGGRTRAQITVESGPDPIHGFADNYLSELATDCAATLTSLPDYFDFPLPALETEPESALSNLDGQLGVLNIPEAGALHFDLHQMEIVQGNVLRVPCGPAGLGENHTDNHAIAKLLSRLRETKPARLELAVRKTLNDDEMFLVDVLNFSFGLSNRRRGYLELHTFRSVSSPPISSTIPYLSG